VDGRDKPGHDNFLSFNKLSGAEDLSLSVIDDRDGKET
jgi:hypothetical protein